MRKLSISALGGLIIPVSAFAQNISVSTSVTSISGALRFGLFDSEAAFEDRQQIAGIAVQVSALDHAVVFQNVPAGNYAIAVFQDLNGSGTLDRNLFGIPTEPYGFSRNPKIGMSAPSYESFEFYFDGNHVNVPIKMNGL